MNGVGLFAGDNYYPHGGVHDWKGRFDTVEDAEAHLGVYCGADISGSWAHVVDMRSLAIIHSYHGERSKGWRRLGEEAS